MAKLVDPIGLKDNNSDGLIEIDDNTGAVAFTWKDNVTAGTPERFRIGTTFVQIPLQGDLRLADADSSNYVGFKAPATVTTNKIWTLPTADGTNGQVLQTNGSAVLSWVTATSVPSFGRTFLMMGV